MSREEKILDWDLGYAMTVHTSQGMTLEAPQRVWDNLIYLVVGRVEYLNQLIRIEGPPLPPEIEEARNKKAIKRSLRPFISGKLVGYMNQDKKKDCEFNLSVDYILKLKDLQENKCELCLNEMLWEWEVSIDSDDSDQWTVDRINNNLGHIEGNVHDYDLEYKKEYDEFIKEYGWRDEWDIDNLEFTSQWYNWKEIFVMISEYWNEKTKEYDEFIKEYGWRDEWDIDNLEFTSQWYNWKEIFVMISEYWNEKTVRQWKEKVLQQFVYNLPNIKNPTGYIVNNGEIITIQSIDHQTELYCRNTISEEKQIYNISYSKVRDKLSEYAENYIVNNIKTPEAWLRFAKYYPPKYIRNRLLKLGYEINSRDYWENFVFRIKNNLTTYKQISYWYRKPLFLLIKCNTPEQAYRLRRKQINSAKVIQQAVIKWLYRPDGSFMQQAKDRYYQNANKLS
ncbi:hypothetical protein Glove_261g43 [Diversispora epigaea]|uniref:Uncharacterized protein n=1 Tax=Diversispora epigaea TaxID=1348612 RepID=A0A397I658_9GLOM|nr:hypothetical protein Glove_261g43 [Diversispora epigaea]